MGLEDRKGLKRGWGQKEQWNPCDKKAEVGTSWGEMR